MGPHVRRVALRNIYLDGLNPRHEPKDAESEIIAHLLESEGVKLLARHIAEIGGTSPLERLAVIPHPGEVGKYITAEGNRRTCALKLLAEPTRAGSTRDIRYFQALSDKMTERINTVEVVVFADRQAARPWVSLRHEGEQGGIGTKSWDARQKARFNAQDPAGGNPNIQATLLIEYAKNKLLLAEDLLDKLPITTVTRYLSNPVFRDVLGLKDGKSLIITVPEDEFANAVKKFLEDACTAGSGVNSRTNVEQRKHYAEILRSGGYAPVTRALPENDLAVDSGDAPYSENSLRASPQTSHTEGGGAHSRSRNNINPDHRKKIIPNDFSVRINDKILKRLYDELRTLDAEQFPFAATYLFRAVIEQMATLLLNQKGHPVPRELNKKLDRVNQILQEQGMSDSKLKNLRVMANDKESRYSPDTIGHFVHGGAVPTRVNTIRAWDSIEPVIKTVLAQLR